MRIGIDLKDEEVELLKKRAKKNLFSLKEQIEDILRRSTINTKPKSISSRECDDKLVNLFSRAKRSKRTKK